MIPTTVHPPERRFSPSRSAAVSARALRVTQISTTDRRGGAAIAANRLHYALGAEGVLSRMLVAQRVGSDPEVLECNPLRPAPSALGQAFFRLGRYWNRPSIARAGAYFTPEWTLTGGRLLSQVPPSDLVNLHWVADLLDYRVLPRLAARSPIVWTFHDMNAFTGGCHYSGSCERYLGRCGACPQLKNSSGEDDMTRRILQRKYRIFERIAPGRLTVVCPSRWLAGEAARSTLCRGFDLRVIPNGVDPREYYPVDRAEARRRLGFPAEARIVLFVAEAMEDRRKGLGFLLEAFQALRGIPGLLLVTLGRPDGRRELTGPAFRQLGSCGDGEMLRTAYSAADVFAIPSLQDNLPNTVLETMACGTPVAGFAAGGITEAVADGRTGLLAPVGDTAALASGLRRLLEDRPLQRALAAEARVRVEREYSAKLQASRYAALYREIVEAEAALP